MHLSKNVHIILFNSTFECLIGITYLNIIISEIWIFYAFFSLKIPTEGVQGMQGVHEVQLHPFIFHQDLAAIAWRTNKNCKRNCIGMIGEKIEFDPHKESAVALAEDVM